MGTHEKHESANVLLIQMSNEFKTANAPAISVEFKPTKRKKEELMRTSYM